MKIGEIRNNVRFFLWSILQFPGVFLYVARTVKLLLAKASAYKIPKTT
jgi:hypothetical protein